MRDTAIKRMVAHRSREKQILLIANTSLPRAAMKVLPVVDFHGRASFRVGVERARIVEGNPH